MIRTSTESTMQLGMVVRLVLFLIKLERMCNQAKFLLVRVPYANVIDLGTHIRNTSGTPH